MSAPDSRPDPDALLERVRLEEERGRRAKLKLFFGFAPGVGKTYAMLELAQRLKAQGVDVVVGYVETHGRSETADLLEGLEVLPRRRLDYRGRTLEELDLEAALARKPAVLLVDELAHTNVPGCKHTKRWQDVIELCEAGIEVHSTVNVQHVESLNDVVAQITGVVVRETVPDAVLDRVDEIELVDLAPEVLLERLTEGKVYLPEQARRAAAHFFQRGHLLALRELALRRTAERVDADVRAYRELHAIDAMWAAGERILVCVGPSPSSAQLVRAARRMAAGLRAPWVAVSIDVTTAPPITAPARARLESHLRLAESLGATVAQVSGNRISTALVDYARKHHVTRIIIGKPTHPRWRDLVRGSIVEEVVRGSGDIDVHVITGDPVPDETLPSRPARSARPYASYLWAVAVVAVTTLCLGLLRGRLLLPDVVAIYLASIMVVAVRFERGPAFLASLLAVAAYDVFFIPPLHTFTVHDLRHVLTFAMMLATALLISALATRIRGQALAARAREERTAALLGLSRALTGAAAEDDAAKAATSQLVESFGGGAAVLVLRAAGLAELSRHGELEIGVKEHNVARWVLEHGRNAGSGTDTLSGANVTCLPVATPGTTLGVLALSPGLSATLSGDQRPFLEAFVRQLALALERARLAEEARAAALRARTEELRSSILSSVSHDLRTPLAVITGAATAVRDDTSLAPAARADLVETVCEEAERLERLVNNLVDMTRIESGAIRPNKEWVPLEEIVGVATGRLESALRGRPLTVELPDDLPLLHVDAILLEQVFINLLDNAVKHTPPGTEIEIVARQAGALEVEVRDRGPGLEPGQESQVFDKFFRRGGVQSGVGLGLTICRAIAEVHGGRMTAQQRPGGGAVFRLELPLEEAPPAAPEPTLAEDAAEGS